MGWGGGRKPFLPTLSFFLLTLSPLLPDFFVHPRRAPLLARFLLACSIPALPEKGKELAATQANSQSMTACGFFSVKQKRTNYGNVFGLVALHKICWSLKLRIRLLVTWIKYLTSKLNGFLVRRRKKKHCVIVETHCMGKLHVKLQLCGKLEVLAKS